MREHPEQYFWMHRRWKNLGIHAPRAEEEGRVRMSSKKVQPIDRSPSCARCRRMKRHSKVNTDDFAKPIPPDASFAELSSIRCRAS